MKIVVLLSITASLILVSCKKEDSGAASSGTRSEITPIAPPAGFTFPRTYTGNETELSKGAWVKNQDISSRINIRTYLGLPAELLTDIQVVLQDRKSLKLIAPDGSGGTETDEYGYYFYKDSLWIITKLPFVDTFAFARGNYDVFDITSTSYRVTGTDQWGYKSNDGGLNGINNKDMVSQYILNSGRLNTIDSLIIYAHKISLQ